MKTWTDPGGKLRELGAESLTDAELLSILISTGTKGKSAEQVCRRVGNDIMATESQNHADMVSEPKNGLPGY